MSTNEYLLYEWIVLSAYTLIAFVGVCVNGFIILTIIKRKLYSTTYLLIANQAASDLLCGVIYLSLWFLCSTWFIEAYGDWVCKVTVIMKLETFFVSALTMMTIAIERYCLICRPLQRGIKAGPAIVLIWTSSLLLALYQMLYWQVSEFFTDHRLIGCRTFTLLGEESRFASRYNFMGTFIFALTLPTLVMIVLYYKVLKKVREIRIEGRENKQERRNRKMTKMLTLIVFYYDAVCVPVFLLLFFDMFFDILPEKCDSTTLQPGYYVICYCLAIGSTAVNPIVCCVYNQKFKKPLYALFCKRKCKLTEESFPPDSGRSFRSRDSRLSEYAFNKISKV